MTHFVRRTRRWMALGAFVAFGASVSFMACSSQPDDVGFSPGGGTPGATDRCAHPNPGCACDAVGATAQCGTVEETYGSFVMCSIGTTICDGTQWGPCQGDGVVVQSRSFSSGGGLHLSALGAQGACSDNPCDPYCNTFDDDGCGVDGGALSNGAKCGLTVGGPDTLCYCDRASDGPAVYGALPAAVRGNPAGCTGGASDNCNHDHQCSATEGGTGACIPYLAGGYNAACIGKPDFTLGMGCKDADGDQQLEVCNRALASAVTGTLLIAIKSGSPSGTPGTSPFPTGPAVSLAADGYCTIDLGASPISPGQCISIDLTSPDCEAASGGGPIGSLTAGQHFAVVNPSTAILPTSVLVGYAPLAECASNNNYTAWSPGLPAAQACSNQVCGTTCGGLEAGAGGEGGASCHTYVTGTVYDPGANVPLPGIAIYQPNVALSPLPVGMSCDTCASVLPPESDIESSTYSEIDGTFALEVTGTTNFPVVFQTGKWRRQITIGVDTPPLTPCVPNNITDPSLCSYPGTNCVTRLPQTRAEGDIPKMAISIGNWEPFQCSIAKFMGGTNEMGVGGAARIQLFTNNGADKYEQTTTYNSGTTASITTIPTLSGKGWIVSGKSGTTVTVTNLSNHQIDGKAVSVSAASGAGVVTVTGLLGVTAADNGGRITFWGANKAANNGTWTITSVSPPGQVTISRSGTVADGNNGKSGFRWSINGPNGNLNSDYVGGTLKLGGGSSGNTGTFPILSVIDGTTVTITNSGGVNPDTKNGQSGLTWTASAVNSVTVSGVTGMDATDVGKTITISKAKTAGNNGSYTIDSVIDPTTIRISNNNAATDAYNGAIHWIETAVGATVSIPADSGLWSNLSTYDSVILPCGGGGASGTDNVYDLSATNRDRVYAFMKSGGKLFANHFEAMPFVVPSSSKGGNVSKNGKAVSPFDDTATFAKTIPGASSTSYDGRVAPNATPNEPQKNFLDWLTYVGAYAGGGVNTPNPVVTQTLQPSSTKAFEWLRAANSDNWGANKSGNFNLVYSFDTNSSGVVPTLLPDGGAGAGCGRMIVSSMHVDTSRAKSYGTGTTFPSQCSLGTGLSPNEAAFEYLMFILSSCSIGGAPIQVSAPPPPPPPPSLPTGLTFTRDFHAVCEPGSRPEWQLFEWQGQFPAGTSIDFAAQVAPDVGGDAGAYAPSTPFSVGHASATTATWTTQAYASTTPTPNQPCTVDQHLHLSGGCTMAPVGSPPAANPNTSPTRSEEWLRVTMTFNTAGPNSPTLTAWRQLFDCVPAE